MLRGLDPGRKTRMNRRTVITGIGPVTCLGAGKEATWAAVQKEQKPFSTMSALIANQIWESYPMAEVTDWDLNSVGLCKQQWNGTAAQRSNRDLLLFASAARIAVEDSKLRYHRATNRVGVVISHENPGFDEYTRQIWRAIETQPLPEGEKLAEHIKVLYSQVEQAGYNTHSFVLLQQLT